MTSLLRPEEIDELSKTTQLPPDVVEGLKAKYSPMTQTAAVMPPQGDPAALPGVKPPAASATPPAASDGLYGDEVDELERLQLVSPGVAKQLPRRQRPQEATQQRGGTLGVIDKERNRQAQGAELAYGAMADAAAAQKAAAVAQADAKKAELEAKSTVLQEQERVQRQHVAEQAGFQMEWGAKMKRMEDDMQDAIQNSMYAMPPEERRHHQSMIDSPYASEEQKAKARQKLKEGSSIDPDRVFGGSTAGKVLAYVAATLFSKIGGMDLLNTIIGNDIAAQRDQFERNRGQAAQTKGLYADMFDRFGDERTAMLGTHQAQLKVVKTKLEDALAQAATEGAAANLQGQIAEIDKQLAVKGAELQDHMLQRSHGLATSEVQAREGMADRSLRREQMLRKEGAGPAPSLEGYVPSGKTTITGEGFKKAQEIVGNSLKVTTTLKDVIDDVKTVGTQVLPTAAAKALAAKGAMLKLALKDSGSLGALDKGSQDFLDEMVGSDLTGMRTSAVLSRLQALEEVTKKQTDALVRYYGYVPAETAAAEAAGARPR